MIHTFIFGMIIWLLGVLLVQYHLDKWCSDKELSEREIITTSLLSWAFYPAYALEWIINKVNS